MNAARCTFAVLAATGMWAQTTVVVSGRVTDANSGLAIEGAAVRIAGYVKFTDAGGTYSFGDVTPGTTAITISAPDYIAFEKTNPNGTTIQVAPDRAVHNFTLVPAASITGRVTGIDRDLPGAFMSATLLKEDFTEGVRHFARGAGTSRVDADGVFRFSGLEPGRYVVRVGPDGSWTLRSPKLSARVRPSEGYTVSYYPGTIEFADALPISLAAGETYPMAFRVPTRPVWRASGELDLPGVAGNEGTLSIIRREEIAAQATLNMNGREEGIRQTTSVSVKVPGPFVVDGLPAGDYVGSLMVFERRTPTGQVAGFFSPSDSLAFTITDRDLEGLRLRPVNRQKLDVQGSFKMADGGPLPAGLSVNFAYSQPGGESTPVPADGGTFWLNTAPGEYSLQPVIPAGYAVESLRYGGFNYLNSLVPMKGDTIDSSVEIVLTNRPGAIYGDSQQPGARMVLVADPVPTAFDFRSIHVTNADARGAFSFTGLTPGRYRVLALTGNDRRQDHDMSLLKDRLSKADTVEVVGR